MNAVLTEKAMSYLRNSKVLTQLAFTLGLPYPSLYRQVCTEHENLTKYKVLYALSTIVGERIEHLVTVTDE